MADGGVYARTGGKWERVGSGGGSGGGIDVDSERANQLLQGDGSAGWQPGLALEVVDALPADTAGYEEGDIIVVPGDGGSSVIPGDGKNLLYNGAMQVAQRGDTFHEDGYCVDRWFAFREGGVPGMTVNRVDGFSTRVVHGLRLQRDAGDTGTSELHLTQALETIDSVPLQGQKVTFSIYARAGADFSSAGQALAIRVSTGTGENQTPNAGWTNEVSANEIVNLTTDLTRYSMTADIPSNATQVKATIYFTPTGTAGAADYIELTGAQLEVGETATEFEHKKYGTELAECKRYFERYSRWNGPQFPQGIAHVDETNRPEVIVFYEPKRAAPTITGSDPSHFQIQNCGTGAAANATSGPLTLIGSYENSANLFWGVSSGWPQWAITAVVIEDGLGYLDIDAEL